jgi:hypothetical protein
MKDEKYKYSDIAVFNRNLGWNLKKSMLIVCCFFFFIKNDFVSRGKKSGSVLGEHTPPIRS